MDLHEFTAEAERLARPATLLKKAGRGEPAAYWHGVKSDQCCISLSRNGRWLNVFLDRAGDYAEEADGPLRSSAPLFAEPYKSLPPVDAVFLGGSSAIEAYLHDNRWSRTTPFNDNFKDPTPARYQTLWQKNCPLYSGDAVAAVGGWHFPWPDGDFGGLVNSELVVWTLEDSEPWIEVFAGDGAFAVKRRIT